MKKRSLFFTICLIFAGLSIGIFLPKDGAAEEKLVDICHRSFHSVFIEGSDITAKLDAVNVDFFASGVGLIMCGGELKSIKIDGKAIKFNGGFTSDCFLEIENVGKVKLSVVPRCIILTEKQKKKLMDLYGIKQ